MQSSQQSQQKRSQQQKRISYSKNKDNLSEALLYWIRSHAKEPSLRVSLLKCLKNKAKAVAGEGTSSEKNSTNKEDAAQIQTMFLNNSSQMKALYKIYGYDRLYINNVPFDFCQAGDSEIINNYLYTFGGDEIPIDSKRASDSVKNSINLLAVRLLADGRVDKKNLVVACHVLRAAYFNIVPTQL
jgi:hypothetical protein